jgi:lipid-A-disaccharide synthase
MSGPKIFVSAGEVSGDQILAKILARLRDRFPDMQLRGLGGAGAMAAGLEPMFPMERTAFSGAWDVLRNLRFALGMYAKAGAEMRRFKPDLVLLVDYPGLNLRLARLARNLGVSVQFVAPPQVWAYRKPTRKLRRAREALRGASVHVLFPFEKRWYEGAAGETSVGHFFDVPNPNRVAEKRIPGLTCLCPGSRLPVLRRNLPLWLDVLQQNPTDPLSRYAVLVPEHLQAEAERILAVHPGRNGMTVEVRSDKSALLEQTTYAIAFPGTITLELALARVPTLILAIVDPITLALGRRLLEKSHLALPNLILKGEFFPEWVGTVPGPSAREVAELVGRRDGIVGWDERLKTLSAEIGEDGGAEAVFKGCLKLLESFTSGELFMSNF